MTEHFPDVRLRVEERVDRCPTADPTGTRLISLPSTAPLAVLQPSLFVSSLAQLLRRIMTEYLELVGAQIYRSPFGTTKECRSDVDQGSMQNVSTTVEHLTEDQDRTSFERDLQFWKHDFRRTRRTKREREVLATLMAVALDGVVGRKTGR